MSPLSYPILPGFYTLIGSTRFVCSEIWLSGGSFRLIKCKRWIDLVACQLLMFLTADKPQMILFSNSSRYVEIIDGQHHSPILIAVDVADNLFLEYPPRDGKTISLKNF